MLKDKEFVEKTIPESTSERHLLYEDPDLKFCIFAHNHHGPKTSQPHDHGPSWAIYGQAQGVTTMTDWELLEPATADKPGKVRKKKDYSMTPGSAYVFNEGDLHSPARTDSTRLIRLEGMNMDNVKRLKFEVAASLLLNRGHAEAPLAGPRGFCEALRARHHRLRASQRIRSTQSRGTAASRC